jgi:hypothetical protein
VALLAVPYSSLLPKSIQEPAFPKGSVAGNWLNLGRKTPSLCSCCSNICPLSGFLDEVLCVLAFETHKEVLELPSRADKQRWKKPWNGAQRVGRTQSRDETTGQWWTAQAWAVEVRDLEGQAGGRLKSHVPPQAEYTDIGYAGSGKVLVQVDSED